MAAEPGLPKVRVGTRVVRLAQAVLDVLETIGGQPLAHAEAPVSVAAEPVAAAAAVSFPQPPRAFMPEVVNGPDVVESELDEEVDQPARPHGPPGHLRVVMVAPEYPPSAYERRWGKMPVLRTDVPRSRRPGIPVVGYVDSQDARIYREPAATESAPAGMTFEDALEHLRGIPKLALAAMSKNGIKAGTNRASAFIDRTDSFLRYLVSTIDHGRVPEQDTGVRGFEDTIWLGEHKDVVKDYMDDLRTIIDPLPNGKAAERFAVVVANTIYQVSIDRKDRSMDTGFLLPSQGIPFDAKHHLLFSGPAEGAIAAVIGPGFYARRPGSDANIATVLPTVVVEADPLQLLGGGPASGTAAKPAADAEPVEASALSPLTGTESDGSWSMIGSPNSGAVASSAGVPAGLMPFDVAVQRANAAPMYGRTKHL
jgi:hypothetical protein